MAQENHHVQKDDEKEIAALRQQLQEQKKLTDKMMEERSAAIAWAVYFENWIRYKHGIEKLSKVHQFAKNEIPRILHEAWSEEIVKRFIKEP